MARKTIMAFVLTALFANASVRAAVPEGDLLEGVKPGPDGFIDVVNIMPHQDDETAYAGGTLAKLAKDPRVRVHLVCLTLGDMSDARYFMHKSKEEMGEIRVKELEAAGRELGAYEVIQLTYHDQGLKPADQEKLIEAIAAIIEQTGAEVVITLDPSGLTHHPDHVTCSRAVTEAVKRGSTAPLYYATLTTGKYLYAMMTSPFHEPGKRAEPTLKIAITDTLPQKRKALYAHDSQMKHSLVGLLAGPYLKYDTEYFALAHLGKQP